MSGIIIEYWPNQRSAAAVPSGVAADSGSLRLQRPFLQFVVNTVLMHGYYVSLLEEMVVYIQERYSSEKALSQNGIIKILLQSSSPPEIQAEEIVSDSPEVRWVTDELMKEVTDPTTASPRRRGAGRP
ncbi:hypothetical protein J6590_010041 [Homalodisca vitripennis]|nr:hypothetical protein J6590_010041 [Homalodisca vitripennis]